MPVLRISQTGSHVETTFVGQVLREQAVVGQTVSLGNPVAQPLPPVRDKRPFEFTLSPQDAEDIRWYLEDYRIYPVDPRPKPAARIEKRMKEVGCKLFQKLFDRSDVWQAARYALADTRIEIETELEDACALGAVA